MERGATLFINISGGKDSQAMLVALTIEYIKRGWTGQVIVVHADLGRAEWPQTPAFVEKLAWVAGFPLVVVRRPQGDLVQEMEDRIRRAEGQYPGWPSAAARYCTAHHKRGQIDKVLRPHSLVVNAMGMRAEESPNRAKKEPVSLRNNLTSKPLRELGSIQQMIDYRSFKQRVVVDWLPIHEWTIGEVYHRCGHSLDELVYRRELYAAGQREKALAGWYMHPAYVFGNNRLSCALCILADLNDLQTGARENPGILETYIKLQDLDPNHTFKQDFDLRRLLPSSDPNLT